jgi:rSAM/selenodomain-associated transferase 1
MKDEKNRNGGKMKEARDVCLDSSFILHPSSLPGTVLVFVKYPALGRVKTRLAATVGAERAATLYRCWIGEVLGVLQPLRGQAQLICCFDGAPRESFGEWALLVDDWWPQPDGDLGERLAAGFQLALVGGGPVLAVGTDCLELDLFLIHQAFTVLADHDVVFGPTPDGGYYLVGMAGDKRGVFASARWSCPETLGDHLVCCRERGWSYGLLPARHDIDTWEDWLEYLDRVGRPRSTQ